MLQQVRAARPRIPVVAPRGVGRARECGWSGGGGLSAGKKRRTANMMLRENNMRVLHHWVRRIIEIDNKGPSVWQRFLLFKPLGFEPIPALGFAMALVMVIGASFLLLNQDGLPNVDFEKLSTQSQQKTTNQFKPSVITPTKNLPSMADSDTSGKSNPKHLENRIQLVGGNK